jgi:surfeit locus 1 family protein
MMRFPLIPTVIVALAVAGMVWLGFWQLDRAGQKDALRARYEQNAKLPPMALPQAAVADEALLFRRASAFCLEIVEWRKAGGQSASGKGGTRFIAECRTGAEGPGFAADMGVSEDPKAQPQWKGGDVSGVVVAEPSRASLWDRILRRDPPPRPMIVSARPAPGLLASAPPSADSFTNNSLSYAVQWFLFALVAAVVYVLALRRRQSRELPPPGPDTISPGT